MTLLRKLCLVTLALLLVSGTVAACDRSEFDWATDGGDDVTQPGELTREECEDKAYNEWLSEYGTTAHRGMDGGIYVLPHPDGLGPFLNDVQDCWEGTNAEVAAR